VARTADKPDVQTDDHVLFVVDEEEFDAAAQDPRVHDFHEQADAEFRRLEDAGRIIY
jgi:hypothetical protein